LNIETNVKLYGVLSSLYMSEVLYVTISIESNLTKLKLVEFEEYSNIVFFSSQVYMYKM